MEHHYVGDPDKNFNKRFFLRYFHLILLIIVNLDKQAPGNFGLVKKSRKKAQRIEYDPSLTVREAELK